jgi:hypothetical protein
MRRLATQTARLYGDHLFHLIVVLAALALSGYTILMLGVHNLFNPHVWWQSIAVWFAVAVIGHDLILFPLYALIDRLLTVLASGHRGRDRSLPAPVRGPVTNYLRMPTLAGALLLLLFMPGIIRQGAPTYHAATGLTQAPYLSRWLLLTATFYLTSAVCYAVKTMARGRGSGAPRASKAAASTEHRGSDALNSSAG